MRAPTFALIATLGFTGAFAANGAAGCTYQTNGQGAPEAGSTTEPDGEPVNNSSGGGNNGSSGGGNTGSSGGGSSGGSSQPLDLLGCYADSASHDLSGPSENSGSMTPAVCVSYCAQQGYEYAGVQGGDECFCGNSYGSDGSSSNCNMPCTGDGTQTCGGNFANDVYATGVANGTPPSSSSGGSGSSSGGSSGGSSSGSTGQSVTLGVMNPGTGCSISINGGTASSSGTGMAQVILGSKATIVATPLAGYTIGADPWTGIDEDDGGPAPGADQPGPTGTESTTGTVTITQNPQCVSVCCPEQGSTTCPPSVRCP